MSRGRRPNKIQRVQFKVFLRIDLVAAIDLLCADPVRGKAEYGAKSQYIEALVERDLAQRRIEQLTTETDARTMDDVPTTEPTDKDGYGND